MKVRMSKEENFFQIAKVISFRSTCPSRDVGCVIVHPEDDRILATGYNGAPRGTAHCDDACSNRQSGKNFEKCKAVHAELNAITNASASNVSVKGGIMYLTTTPCLFCSRVIINAGISEVRAMSIYPHQDAIDLLNEGGVKVKIYSGVPNVKPPKIGYEIEVVEHE